MGELNVGDWRLTNSGSSLVIEHLPSGNQWNFRSAGELDIPGDLSGRVNKTIYDASEQKIPGDTIESKSKLYPNRRV